LQVGESVEGRLEVPRAGELLGPIARFDAERAGLQPDHGLEQPQEGTPALHRLAEVVHRHGVVLFDEAERCPGLGQDVVRNRREAGGKGREGGPDGLAREERWLIPHATLFRWPCGTIPRKRSRTALPTGRASCYIPGDGPCPPAHPKLSRNGGVR